MLKTRILTAIVLLPLVISAILYLSHEHFLVISALVFSVGLWEWTRMSGFVKIWTRLGAMLLMPVLAFLILAILKAFGKQVVIDGTPLLVIGFWISAVFMLYRYPSNISWMSFRCFGIFSGCLVLFPSWALLVALQDVDPRLVLYVLALVCIADTAAYFAGKRFGKTKLAPNISPNKTWEGAMGALTASLLVIAAGHHLLQPLMNSFSWVLLGLITVSFSIVGDLWESAFKRNQNLKDSGICLPGHGGILDRIDSLTAAIPIFTIGYLMLVPGTN